MKPCRGAHSSQVGEAAEQQAQVPAQRHEPLQLLRGLEDAADGRGGGILVLSRCGLTHLHHSQQPVQVREAARGAVALHHAGQVGHVHRQLHEGPHGRAEADAAARRLPVVGTDVALHQDARCG